MPFETALVAFSLKPMPESNQQMGKVLKYAQHDQSWRTVGLN